MKVYMLTSGGYEECHVVGIFSTREKAEEYISLVPDDYYDEIEEMEVDSGIPEKIRDEQMIYRIEFSEDGDVEKMEIKYINSQNIRDMKHYHFLIDVIAKDIKEALKIARAEREKIKKRPLFA